MIWWKESFEKINSELELVNKKRKALEDLLNSGKISQSTYEYYNKQLVELEEEIENRRKMLIERMNSKVNNLEQQLQILEMLFADIEISHVAGEIDDEAYAKQRDILSTGLEFARQELQNLKDTLSNLESIKIELPKEQPTLEEAVEEATEVSAEPPAEEKLEEQIPVESPEVSSEETEPQQTEEVSPPETPIEDVTMQATETECEETTKTVETQA